MANNIRSIVRGVDNTDIVLLTKLQIASNDKTYETTSAVYTSPNREEQVLVYLYRNRPSKQGYTLYNALKINGVNNVLVGRNDNEATWSLHFVTLPANSSVQLAMCNETTQGYGDCSCNIYGVN